MTRAGYAIEYDYYPPTQLDAMPPGASAAGVILRGPDQWHHRLRRGGGQGVVAGMNAARRA